MRKTRTVTWAIEVDAYSAEDAAEQAQRIQRDSNPTANVFVVDGEQVDLDSKEYLEHAIAIVRRDITELEYGDDRLMTDANGNRGRYEILKERERELADKLRNL